MKRHLWKMATFLIMALIFFFSSQNAESSSEVSGWFVQFILQIPHAVFIVRKAAHFILYASLAYCMIHTWKQPTLAKNVTVCFLYACSDEIHQLFSQGRSGQISDILWDTFAALCITAFYLYIKKRLKQKRI